MKKTLTLTIISCLASTPAADDWWMMQLDQSLAMPRALPRAQSRISSEFGVNPRSAPAPAPPPAPPKPTVDLRVADTHKYLRSCALLSSSHNEEEGCLLERSVLQLVGRGAALGLVECQHQLKDKRWNCSVEVGVTHVRRRPIDGSREKAFLYSISSAGVAHLMTRSCAKGEIPGCSCDTTIATRKRRSTFEWGGCSEDVLFGCKFSEEFVDANENGSTPDSLMNLHNNRVGRLAVKKSMKRLCKCHGISGSCSMKICWRKLKSFRDVGDVLSKSFESARRQLKFSRNINTENTKTS